MRLAQVFADEPLDFVLFFSAVQTFLKAPGQSNYAAGCTFQDAFAHQLRQAWSCPVKIINWGYWGSIGIVKDAFYRERMAAAGIGSIEPEDGMAALHTLLNGPWHQLALVKTLKPAGHTGHGGGQPGRLDDGQSGDCACGCRSPAYPSPRPLSTTRTPQSGRRAGPRGYGGSAGQITLG